MTIAYDDNAKRWRHTDGTNKGRFATQAEVDGQSETPPGNDRSIGRTSGLTDETIGRILDLLEDNNGILRHQAERRAFIEFVICCGICILTANSSHAIVDIAFSAHYNWGKAVAFAQTCKSKPWDCLRGKVPWPDFNVIATPDTNIGAMLSLIAWAEGADYDVSYTGQKFADFADHPRALYTANGISSDAAGRYQFLSPTWDSLKAKLKLKDFSPQSQDKAAIELMKQCHGYGYAVRGDVAGFADRCWSTWASLHSRDGQKLDDRQRSHPIAALEKRFNELRAGRGTSPAIAAPLPAMQLTSSFSPNRIHPVTGAARPHNGADYACLLGAPVLSPIAGTFHRGMADPKGFGSSWGVVMNAKTRVVLGHTRRILVPDMAQVKRGQPIAECGSEGISNGPHLHLEVEQDGKLINPETLIGKK
jgi:muramidase (phage lysozyme)